MEAVLFLRFPGKNLYMSFWRNYKVFLLLLVFVCVEINTIEASPTENDIMTSTYENTNQLVTISPDYTTAADEQNLSDQLQHESNNTVDCKMSCRSAQSTPNLFSTPQKGPLGLHLKACVFLSLENDRDSCVTNLAVFFAESLQDKSDLNFVLYLQLQCETPMHIHIKKDDTDLSSLKPVIGYLSVKGCDIYWGDIAMYGDVVDLRVLYLNDWVDKFDEERRLPSSPFHTADSTQDVNILQPLPPGLRNIGTLALYSTGRGQVDKVHKIFLRYEWSLLAEVMFHNMSYEELPESLIRSMPRLQTIESEYTMLNYPPSFFPWDNRTFNLPRSLCRTNNANNHYTKTFFIPCHTYRRVLNLKHGNISDLSNLTIEGSLHKIGITYCNVQRIGPDIFRHVQDVQHIDLSNNELKSVPSTTFHGLHALIQLNLNRNQLENLPTDTFTDLPELRILHIEHNKMVAIGSKLFYHLPSLQTLDISNNMLQNIAQDAVNTESDKMQQFLASHNKLQHIPHCSLLLRNLLKVDFSHNQVNFGTFHRLLSEIDYSHLVYQHREDATQLSWQSTQLSIKKDLDLSDNNFNTFQYQQLNQSEESVFFFLTYFFNIHMEGNAFFCDCHMYPLFQYFQSKQEDADFNKFYFNNWKCSSPPDLAGVPVAKASKEAFRCPVQPVGCPNGCVCYNRTADGLLQVDCSSVNHTSLPETLPRDTKHLNLRNSSLQKLDQCPSYLSKLEVLDVSQNQISFISECFVKSMASIEKVYLDHNKLAYFPKPLQSLEPAMDVLTVGHNPIKCDCHSTWVKDWLLIHRRVITDIYSVVCASGRGQGEILVEVPIKDFICEALLSETYRNLAISLGVIMFAMISVALLVYRYRGEIKVLLYVHFNWHPFDKHDDEDMDKLYDAFISYSAKDYKWVCHVLRKKLETGDSNTPGYKLCLHDRDFKVGAPIQENIMDAVTKSRRMILVLSRNFVLSDWCMLEFRTAHLKVLKDKVKYLIVILYDDIHKNELDDDLKLYLDTNTYLSIRNKWFWEKLYYALPETPIQILRPDLPKPKQLSYPAATLDSMPRNYSNPNYRVELDQESQEATMFVEFAASEGPVISNGY